MKQNWDEVRSDFQKARERTVKRQLTEQIAENRAVSKNHGLAVTLARFMLQDTAALLLPGERVAWCLKRIVPLKDTVEVHKVSGGKRAVYRNLQTCGSIWHCPVCASRITEQRRIELSHSLAKWEGTMVMITYTLAHNQRMELSDVLESIKYAYQATKSGKVYQGIKRDFWIAGSVRALEVTYGANGWHVHIHEVCFIDKRDSRNNPVSLSEAQTSDLQNRTFNSWRNALKRRNKATNSAYGVHVTNADNSVAEYVAKYGREPIESHWDITHELTKQVTKRAIGQNVTPLELLAEFAEGNVKSGNLWLQYARCFKGSKQLVWSTGIRKLLKLTPEETDQQLSETVPPEFEPFIEIERRDWIAIRSLKRRGDVLQFASEHSADETRDYIAELSLMFWGE